MSRWEFMRRLEELLYDIAPGEREEALQYYNDYFNDAGKENEQEVMDALGSPEQVAQIVKDGLGESGEQGAFTEKGFSSGQSSVQNELAKRTVETEYHSTEDSYTSGEAKPKEKEGMPGWALALIIIGCILFSPVILAVLTSVIAALFSLVCAVIGLIVGFGIASLVLFVVAVILVIFGFSCIIPQPIGGIGLLGAAFICAALGILFMLLTAFIAGKCVPGIIQGLAYIFKKLFGKKGGVQA